MTEIGTCSLSCIVARQELSARCSTFRTAVYGAEGASDYLACVDACDVTICTVDTTTAILPVCSCEASCFEAAPPPLRDALVDLSRCQLESIGDRCN